MTGPAPRSGNGVSHSHRSIKRRFEASVHRRRYRGPSEQRRVTLAVSARGMRVIEKRGIDAIVRELRLRGEIL